MITDFIGLVSAYERSHTHTLATNSPIQATNQLLTALDRLRSLPNILVCCTSNLVEAIVSKVLKLCKVPCNKNCTNHTHFTRTQLSSIALTSSNTCLPRLPQRCTTSSAAASMSFQGAVCSPPAPKAPTVQTPQHHRNRPRPRHLTAKDAV